MNYVFSYLSLLDEGSKVFNSEADIVPVKLSGYIRTWRTERDSENEDFKRYIDLEAFKMVDRFCWSTLRKEESRFVNGILMPTSDADLLDFDIREVGYNRIDITDKVVSYDGFTLNPEFKIWVYIAPETKGGSLAYIDADYVNGGLVGSKDIDNFVPGFLNDYIDSTQVCTAIIRDIHQVFIGNDGRGLYILNRKEKSVILIHKFKNTVYTPRSDMDVHSHWPICSTLGQYDVRIIQNDDTVFNDALRTSDQIEIYSFIEAECPWINMMLLRNENVSPQAKDNIIKKMDNWIIDLIAMDELLLPLSDALIKK